MTDEPERFDTDDWQHGFWTGYRLGFVRGRLVAWAAYVRRLRKTLGGENR